MESASAPALIMNQQPLPGKHHSQQYARPRATSWRHATTSVTRSNGRGATFAANATNSKREEFRGDTHLGKRPLGSLCIRIVVVPAMRPVIWMWASVAGPSTRLTPSDSSQFPSTCSSLPLVFGCSNVVVNLSWCVKSIPNPCLTPRIVFASCRSTSCCRTICSCASACRPAPRSPLAFRS